MAAEADLGRPTTLWLVRHARTEDTGRVLRGGHTDGPDLDPEGRRQAERLARRLTDPGGGVRPVTVVSAPALRARRTAWALAETLDLPVRVDDDWAEVRLGEWDGLGYAEIAARWPEDYRRWRGSTAVAPPGGESLDDVFARIATARAALVAAHSGRAVLVVTHTAPVRTVLAQALEAGPAAMWRLRVDPAGLSVVRYWRDGGCEVAGVNLGGGPGS